MGEYKPSAFAQRLFRKFKAAEVNREKIGKILERQQRLQDRIDALEKKTGANQHTFDSIASAETVLFANPTTGGDIKSYYEEHSAEYAPKPRGPRKPKEPGKKGKK